MQQNQENTLGHQETFLEGMMLHSQIIAHSLQD